MYRKGKLSDFFDLVVGLDETASGLVQDTSVAEKDASGRIDQLRRAFVLVRGLNDVKRLQVTQNQTFAMSQVVTCHREVLSNGK